MECSKETQVAQDPMADLAISTVLFEHHRQAFGIAETKPRITWRFEGTVSDWEQSAYDIEVARNGPKAHKPSLFSFNSSDSLYVPWPDKELAESEAASVRVRAHGSDGLSTPWSDWAHVETGLLSEKSWVGAVPITADIFEQSNITAKRPIYFRRDFQVPRGAIASARLYITGLGIYEAEINGKRVGDLVLAPGWQSYNHRHVYDSYDVTSLLKSGKNAIGVVVGEGWFLGRLGPESVTVGTDGDWRASGGPIVSGEIYDGEIYDARLAKQIQGWSTATFAAKAKAWRKVRTLPSLKGKLTPPDGPGIRRIEEKEPERILKSPSGKTIIDFGQNLVGWLRVHADGPANTNITFRHAEVLVDGELALKPLRTAKAADTIILAGDGPITWEPKFTFHGFRYAQVGGWPKNKPLKGSIKAVVVHTDLEETGWFECSNQALNQLHSNVRWSMKGNFLSIPMDCPQRDERLGWTGWHKDLASEAAADGSMVPRWYTPMLDGPTNQPIATAVWGDVVVGNPWNMYKSFGDNGLLQEHLAQGVGWLDKGIYRNEAGLWNRQTFQYGDWLDPKSPPDDPGQATTHKFLVADAYLVRMTEVMSQITASLRETTLSERYASQHTYLKAQFQKAWTNGEGALANRTQTAYSLAISFGLFDDEKMRKAATKTLRDIVAANNYLIGTGFAGTPALSDALRSVNATEDFYRILLQTKVPSWLYQVEMGATTTWERWDSLLPNGTLNPGEMTSFNHYSYGSVAQFLHETVGGLAPDKDSPGYKTVVVAPIPGGGITSAITKHLGPYGMIEVGWSAKKGKGFNLQVKVPPNSWAVVKMPGSKHVIKVGSGIHSFIDLKYQI
ncbi:alpha-l-rhamnosidase a [Fusarium flagelliforme]|uniref:alpha-L-rhamnosidase n=1 Tax=Fusarium flagelliforme TaxID=2675880 RepID=A0A395MEK9_9HYPO|nr:alpha-l-rhamnosidase a [Fusarium flagelliforme]